MATTGTLVATQAGGEQPLDVRRMMKALTPDAGVIGASDLTVAAQGTPNMTVAVAAGGAFLAGTSGTRPGTYYAEHDSSDNLTIAAADATNPRNDLIVIEALDAFYSGAVSQWRLRVVQGTPAASPVDPAVTGNVGYQLLARVRVNAGATSITNANITDLRTITGPLRAPSKTGKRIHWGVGGGTPDGNSYVTITHGAPFTPTVVLIESGTTSGGGAHFQSAVDNITATTFRVRILGSTGALITVPVTGIMYACFE